MFPSHIYQFYYKLIDYFIKIIILCNQQKTSFNTVSIISSMCIMLSRKQGKQ